MKIGLLLGLTPLGLQGYTLAFAEEVSLVSGEFAPFSGEKLFGGGLSTLIMVKAFSKAGFKAKVTFLPWARGYHEALHNRFLGTFPYTKTEERQREFLYSEPLYIFRVDIFTRAKKIIDFQKIEDLKGMTIVQPLGYSVFSLAPMVERHELKLERATDLTGAFKMIEASRADFVVLAESVGWREVEKIFGDRKRFRTLEKPLEMASDSFIISKSNPRAQEYIDIINKSIVSMKKSGEIERLLHEFVR